MSKRKQDKDIFERLPTFIPLFIETLNAPAWRALSHGARSLYVALKAHHNPKRRNNRRIYLSYRDARRQIGSGFEEIATWFRELQHYGFIEMTTPGSLGVSGKGRAPHWRLTELPYIDEKGEARSPTKEYLHWNGIKFRRKHTERRARNSESRYGNPVRTVTGIRSTGATGIRNAS